jgi:hypothetical protein
MVTETEEFKRTMNLIESGDVRKGMKKADRPGEAKKSGELVKALRGASGTRASDPYFKATRKADEIVNVKRDPGITGTRMTLSDKVVKTKMSDVDKERGLGKKTKTKKTPETKASVKKRGHGLTFKASQEKVKDIKNINPKDIPKVKKSREINIEAPATVAKSFRFLDSNPRKKFSGFDSESKERKVRGFSQGGLVYGKKFSGTY